MEEIQYANSVLEQPWWLDVVAPGNWKEIIINDDKTGEILARFVYVTDGKKVYMPEKTQNLGIWMSEKALKDYKTQKDVINKIFVQLEQYKSISHVLNPKNEYVLPFRWLGYNFKTNFTYRIEDLSDIDKIKANFSKSTKRNIKYAAKHVDVISEISIDQAIETMWNLLIKTYAFQKRKYPVSKDFTQRYMRAAVENQHGKYFEARDKEGNVHSCAFYLFDSEVCYYLTGARNPEFSSSQSQELLLWEGIQFASQHSKIFDFEGSMVEGIENFFRQFGTKSTPYYILSKQSMLNDIKDVIKPRIKKLIGYKI